MADDRRGDDQADEKTRKDLEAIRAELDDLQDELDELLESEEENAFFPPKDREKHANERDER